MGYKKKQEAFWSGEFGDCYIERNECTEGDFAGDDGTWFLMEKIR